MPGTTILMPGTARGTLKILAYSALLTVTGLHPYHSLRL